MPPLDVGHFEELKSSGDLPSPKGVALAIMRMTQQDDVSMTELARTIRTDPAFVGRLIKAANGIIGYGRRPIASVQDALTVLGLPAVRTMALGFSLMNNFRSGPCEGFDYEQYWSSCLAIAVTTQAVTLRTRAAAPDETYCLGLLARVGELAMATLFTSDYSKMLATVAQDPEVNVLLLENQLFGMNHSELGSAMLADWGMPRVFSEAAFLSETTSDCGLPDASRERVLTETLMFSRAMGQLIISADAVRPVLMPRVLALASRLSFDEETTSSLCDGVAREWSEWGALLSVGTTAMPPFERLMRADAAPPQVEPVTQDLDESPALEGAGDAPAAPLEFRKQASALKALLASADTTVRNAIKQVLLNAGYDVAEVHDVAMAAECALDFEPDVLLIDHVLTERGGDAFIKSVRQTRIGRGMFIAMLSETTDEEFRVKAYELGVDDVLPRNVSARLLSARLRASTRLSSLQEEIDRDREEIRHFAAELAVSNRRLQEVAMIDPLTGFPNRRFFIDRLMQEWAAASRNKRPVSCVVINVDNFRTVNETYGHEVGDSVLRQISVALRQVVRTQDVVARTGGDEFLVMCPDTPLEAAQYCAERLRLSVESADIVSGLLKLKMKVSVGVASRDNSISDPDTLIRRAEGGLQIARQAGGNRVSSLQLRPASGFEQA